MNESEIVEMLSMVPVFAISDGAGRAVLMRKNETDVPEQLLFTDVDVGRAHALGVKKASQDASLELRLATLTAAHAYAAPSADQRHVVVLVADPRELHVARQLLLRANGVSTNLTDEAAVERAANALDTGLDLAAGVPLFTLDSMNASVHGDKQVQPWFMSFADLAQQYVATHATNASDSASSGAALSQMLAGGGLVVSTLDKVLETVRRPESPAALAAFIVPPSSSVEVLKEQLARGDAAPGGAAAQADSDSMIRQAAERIQAEEGGAGLFGDDDASLFE
ncbi:hypothetical protein M885DRAFT_530183 [Pelagophyceae sp. CCMP2097]|nr:hypothetical protein M885DRAFT_530183 [Pelagophyceae sp. CCMP2097]